MNTGFSAKNRHDGLWEVRKHVEPVHIFHTSWRTIVVWTAKNAVRGSGLKRWPYASPLNVLAIDWKKPAPRDSQLLVRCLTPDYSCKTWFHKTWNSPTLPDNPSFQELANLQGNLFLNDKHHCFLYVFSWTHWNLAPPRSGQFLLVETSDPTQGNRGLFGSLLSIFFRVSDQDHKKRTTRKGGRGGWRIIITCFTDLATWLVFLGAI